MPCRPQFGPVSQQWPERSGPVPATHSVLFLAAQSPFCGSTSTLMLGNFLLKMASVLGAASVLKGCASPPQVLQRSVTGPLMSAAFSLPPGPPPQAASAIAADAP